jgi:hypothetical protein
MKARLFVCAFLGCSIPIFGVARYLSARPAPEDVAVAGIPPLVLSEFGGVSRETLERTALPYKVASTALVFREESKTHQRLGRENLKDLYRRFGFLFPDSIGNWPRGVKRPAFDKPLGLVGHNVRGPLPFVSVDVVNIGCSTCHSGMLYDSLGRPTNTGWVGIPNTSIDLDSYTQSVYEGLKLGVAKQDAFTKRVEQLFPEMSMSEKLTLRLFLMRRLAGRMREIERGYNRALPFSNGGPGRSNGPAALRFVIGMNQSVNNHGYVSIPAFAGRGVRRSLLADGVYSTSNADDFTEMDSTEISTEHVNDITSIASFFILTTMGTKVKVAEKQIPQLRPSIDWIARRSAAPRFPGHVDSALAASGEAVFAKSCAKCHGTYSSTIPRSIVSYPNRLVPEEEIETDSARLETIEEDVIGRIGATSYGPRLRATRTGGYMPPILLGIWITAPYLHNGSVPTLWQLLNPDERPKRFFVGGHALDMTNVGIAGHLDSSGTYVYPDGYKPWSTPQLFDTTEPGSGNGGHTRQVMKLTAEQKRAVLEYLKTL